MLDTRPMQASGAASYDTSAALYQRGGFVVLPKLIAFSDVRAMFEEARSSFRASKEEKRVGADSEDWRGGLPPRQLLCVQGGPIQDRLYVSPKLAYDVSRVVGQRVVASSNRASYSYYCRQGDHIGVHRDVAGCDVSVIVVISDNTSRDREGGDLLVYPDRMHEPLSAVRRSPEVGAQRIKLRAGETLVLLGGLVPHLVRPVSDGHYRICAPMCFRIV